jgi:hypothetical protein
MGSIDGIKKKQIKKVKPTPQIRKTVIRRTIRKVKRTTRPQTQVRRTHKTFSKRIFSLRTVGIVAATFVVTFFISVATSQGIAKYKGSESHTSTKTIQQAEIKPEIPVITQPKIANLSRIIDDPTKIFLPIEEITAPDPLEKRKEFLEEYLRAKKSPLADHVDTISEQSQWKLIIAISRAESSFCKRHRVNNCWGIGGAWNLRSYENYDLAVEDVNRILETYYISRGLNSPSKMVRKWVGHESETWEAAVEQELRNLEKIEKETPPSI